MSILMLKKKETQRTSIVEMGLRIFFEHPDVELPHYLVEPLLHCVDCERGIVKIGDQDVGIKRLIPVILGLPYEMDELLLVDDDQGELGDKLKEINGERKLICLS